MNKMREEFEAWYSDFDGYGDAHKQELWETWKASRAALCVELPRCWNDEQRDYRDNMVDRLDDVGVSHK